MVGFDEEEEISKLLEDLKRQLPLVSLGDVKQLLGLEIEEENGSYAISLRGYIEKSLRSLVWKMERNRTFQWILDS
jgi:hypothetical protein